MKLNENFNQSEFIEWIGIFLPDFSKDIRKVDVSKSFQGIKSIQTIGESPLGVRVYIIETEQDPSRRKIGLATESFTLLRDYGTPNAIIVYYSENSSLWRLSLLTSTLTWDEGKIKKKLSNPKRQSYVLGSKAKVKTPHQYLISKGAVTDFADLKSRFSLEVVNKEFYKEISGAFIHLVGGQIANGKSKKTVEAQLKLPFVKDHSQTSQEFAVRLIGRIIFCWFLREKRSASGHSLMPKELLSFEASSTIEDYYHKILEPIFFEVLNKPIKTRKDAFVNDLFSAIPYLNGGLFSPHEDDFFNYNEGKQAVNHNMVVVPDAWLKSLFEVLETFNFTIDENTSFDEELSIDPEMLGRIFENLLAEINPETGESARKSTGSYYTPRVIVDYMVDESLYLFLKEKTGISEEKLRSLISYDLEDDTSSPLNDEEKDKIAQALGSIKILDPACGSGAFPIGALQKIVFILQQIDQHGQLWFKKQIQNTPIELRKVIEREFQEKNFDYIRKLGIIRENIYGIDIQPIATEISRLRCFLTLVVDERIDDTLENRGIEPLPNLDFKFVTANTLVGLPTTIGTTSQVGLFEDNEGINELKEVRDMFFNASGFERDQLKLQFYQIQKGMLQRLIDESRRGHADLTSKLTTWDPFSHKAALWFDPEWMFGIRNGFDVVLANPPYLSLEDLQDNKELYKNSYKTAASRGDLYCLFYEKGIQLSKIETGILTFITSNKWLRSGYGENLRNLFSLKNPLLLLDFGNFKFFDSATVNTNILIVNNSSNNNQLLSCVFRNDFKLSDNIHIYFQKNKVELKNITNESWFIGTRQEIDLKRKIEKEGVSIKNWNAKINYGIKTGFNEAFLISKQKKDELIALDPTNIDLIKPILRGRDILSFKHSKPEIYVILAKFGSSKIIEEKYPIIFEHLKKYQIQLQKRGQCSYSRSKKAAKNNYPGQHHWLELDNNPSDEYLKLFSDQSKISWIELVDRGRFAYVEPGIYTEATTFIMTIDEPKYVVGLLNSKLVSWYFDSICGESGVGTNRWKKFYVEQIPLPKVTQDNKDIVDKIKFTVDRILDLNIGDAEILNYQKTIDDLVYRLFDLDQSQIKIIEAYD